MCYVAWAHVVAKATPGTGCMIKIGPPVSLWRNLHNISDTGRKGDVEWKYKFKCLQLETKWLN